MAPVALEGRLGELSREARVFPAHLLRDGGSGLCLFAARFYGVNDAIHMARNNMTLDLVDTSPRIWELEQIYAPNVMVYEGDAWEYAEEFRRDGRQWDAVSADSYTGDAERRSLDSLELWCSLARDVVTVTHTPHTEYVLPDGWTGWIMERSDRANWLVLERA
jgi:hypothetical protein